MLAAALAMVLLAALPAAISADVASGGADLHQTRKLASQDVLGPDETLTYTIELVNTGAEDTLVDVSDPIPPELLYVEGSVSHDGMYMAESATLVWDQIPLAVGETVALTFDVRSAAVAQDTEVVNIAAISYQYGRFVRTAQITVLANDGAPPVNVLYYSDKTASQPYVGSDDLINYTITLRNDGDAEVMADVTDPVPAEVSYLDGSASAGGMYDANTNTVYWEDVLVAAGGQVVLSFQAATPSVEEPVTVVNKATISYEDHTFDRQATVIILPGEVPPMPKPIFAARKMASERVVESGETFTYRIELINSGTADVTANVVDPLPAAVTYVDGSASHGGSYDADDHTVSWSDVIVPLGNSLILSFDVTANEVDHATVAENKAKVMADDTTYPVRARVLILPELPGGDMTRPTVQSLVIGDADVLTDPEVNLTISASDDMELESMLIQEWIISESRPYRWQLVQSSGWVPFASVVPWMLTDDAGVHVVGVVVADKANNMSRLTGNAMDYASLLLPEDTVGEGGLVAYFVNYDAGTDVTANLATLSGDADLYVWFPGNFGTPDLYSIEEGTAPDMVMFTAPTSGRYIFAVRGFLASTYVLDLSPAGGPVATLAAPASALAYAQASPTVSDATKSPLASLETVIESGVDPLAGAQAPRAAYRLHLPTVLR
jgi:uncharacterized repeat protein (TIGR01451 family)